MWLLKNVAIKILRDAFVAHIVFLLDAAGLGGRKHRRGPWIIVRTMKQVVLRNWVEKAEAASQSSPAWGPDGSWGQTLVPGCWSCCGKAGLGALIPVRAHPRSESLLTGTAAS